MRELATWLLVWALSPVGTVLNAGMLATALVLMTGSAWDQPMLWVIVALFVATSAYFDVRAYVARRRNGLSAYEASAAVMDRVWGPRQAAKEEDA